MGWTVMPFSYVLEAERSRKKDFRKGLSKEDQGALIDFPPSLSNRKQVHFEPMYRFMQRNYVSPQNAKKIDLPLTPFQTFRTFSTASTSSLMVSGCSNL